MEKNDQKCDKKKIALWGVGNWGGKILESLAPERREKIAAAILDSDMSSLIRSGIENKISVGKEITGGMGTGGDTAIAEAAFRKSEKAVRGQLEGVDILLLTGGLGGGIGSVIIPGICRLAEEMGIFTVVLATRPFDFEGKKKINIYRHARSEIEESAVGLACFYLDRLKRNLEEEATVEEVYRYCDGVLKDAVECVISYLTSPFPAGGDCAALGNILAEGGQTVLSRRESEGAGRLVELTKETVTELSLNAREFQDAGGVLIGIDSRKSIAFDEINAAISVVANYAGDEVNLLYTAGREERWGERTAVTIIVSGLAEEKKEGHPSFPVILIDDGHRDKQAVIDFKKMDARGEFQDGKPTICDGEDLDIPTFIRRGETLE